MKTFFKWTLRVFLALIVIILVAAFVMYMIGGSKTTQSYAVEGLLNSVPDDSASVARGERLSHAFGCTECHGANLGGVVMGDAPPFLLASANISGGIGSNTGDYTIEDWDRAIRHGIGPDGKPILIMPSASYHKLADTEISDLIAYLQTIEPVDNEVPKSKVKPLGRILLATGAPFYEIDVSPTEVVAPPAGPTAEYGGYLGRAMCTSCHGENFEGGPSPDPELPAPSLASASKWDAATFAEVLRTGVRPNGESLDSLAMPYKIFRYWTDDEITGLHKYLRSVIE